MSVLVSAGQIGVSNAQGNLSLNYVSANDPGDGASFSNNNGGDFNYQPVAGAQGDDMSITHSSLHY